MTIQTYLKQELRNCSRTHLKTSDQELLSQLGMQQFIQRKLTSKKFRKYALTPECYQRIIHAIATQVGKQLPLNVVYPQGGYKLWRLPSSPHVDWAEFFAISYVLQYLAPVLAAYQPGVELTFYMHAMLPELHDNLTTKEIDEYIRSFEALLVEFRRYLPKNCSIRLLRDLDIYSREEYIEAARIGIESVRTEYPNWPNAKKQAYRKMAELNIKWNGREDWTRLTTAQKENKILQAAYYEAGATTRLVRVGQAIKSPDTILLFNTGMRDFIGIGTTKASIAKYWVGVGALKQKDGGWQSLILSPKQYETALANHPKSVSTSLIGHLPNFDRIMVLPN